MMFVSLASLVAAVYFYQKTHFTIYRAFTFAIFGLISLSLYVMHFAADYFTGEGINHSVLFYVRYGLGGAGVGEYTQMIAGFGLLVLVAIVAIWYVIKRTLANTDQAGFVLAGFVSLLAIVSISTNPAVFGIYSVLQYDYPNQPFVQTLKTLGTQNAEAATMESFTDFYKYPILKKENRTKNLVFIYLESLEQTYSDPTLFPNLTPELDGLSKLATNFDGQEQLFGTEFTIAGMVASQCGVPLVTSSHGNTMGGMDKFLPAVQCLGDFLKDRGYYNAYIGGSKLSFAGKGTFYQTHGFEEVKGFEELAEITSDQNYKNGWGLYDDTLFELLYQRFEDLSKTKEKFSLFTLTLDTHHPNGQTSKSCESTPYGDGKNEILNAVYCSDRLVAEFVKKIMESPYGQDTVIVLASDHLAMRNTAFDILETANNRRNRLMIIDPDTQGGKTISVPGSTLDTAPSILPFIGYRSDEFGLGRNLAQNNLDLEEINNIHARIMFWLDDLRALWSFPTIQSGVTINPESEKMFLENREFGIPVAIQLKNRLETVLRFEFSMPQTELSLLYNLDQLEGDSYLVVEKCEKINDITPTGSQTDYCLLTKVNGVYKTLPIENEMHMSMEEILDFVESSQENTPTPVAGE